MHPLAPPLPGNRCAPASRLLEGRVPEGAWGGALLQTGSLRTAPRSTLALFATFLAFGAEQMDHWGKVQDRLAHAEWAPKPHRPDSLMPGEASPQNAVYAARLGYAWHPRSVKERTVRQAGDSGVKGVTLCPAGWDEDRETALQAGGHIAT